MEISGRKAFVGFVAALVMTACLGFASWGSHRSKRATVSFFNTIKFNNGDVLPAGTYHMAVPQNKQWPEVQFSRDGKIMATVKADVVPQATKNSRTEVDSVTRGNDQLVKEIRPAGWHESLKFVSRHEGSKST